MSVSPLCDESSFQLCSSNSGKAKYHSTDVGITNQQMSRAAMDNADEINNENDNDNGSYNHISNIGSQYNLYGILMNPLILVKTRSFHYDLVDNSLPEVHGSIAVPEGENASWYRMMLTFVGPGVMVAVGYMDPGNWSTDIAGGSQFGYRPLLFVVLMASLCAMFLQCIAAKAGIATNRDLAQICRDAYPLPLVYVLWIVAEIAIMATDIAEVIGSAVALKLLFGLPLAAGVVITIADVAMILLLQGRSFRYTEIIVGVLVLTISICFAIQLALAKPPMGEVFLGYVPNGLLFTNHECLFIAIGIMGATVMPHNLFLHSSIILTRCMKRDDESLKKYTRYAQFDSTMSLVGALFVNSAILILAASTFYRNGYQDVATLEDAYMLLDPLLGGKTGQILFGVALLLSGLNATLTGTLTGQIVMEGFTKWTIRPVYRRLITRALAILPALLCILIGGDAMINTLLLYSQVILSFALPFAVFPLVHITSSPVHMGALVNSFTIKCIAYVIAFTILTLNILLFM